MRGGFYDPDAGRDRDVADAVAVFGDAEVRLRTHKAFAIVFFSGYSQSFSQASRSRGDFLQRGNFVKFGFARQFDASNFGHLIDACDGFECAK